MVLVVRHVQNCLGHHPLNLDSKLGFGLLTTSGAATFILLKGWVERGGVGANLVGRSCPTLEQKGPF